jgi:hypothetical protein
MEREEIIIFLLQMFEEIMEKTLQNVEGEFQKTKQFFSIEEQEKWKKTMASRKNEFKWTKSEIEISINWLNKLHQTREELKHQI